MDDEQLTAESIFEYFSRVTDPRVARTRKHPLTSVLVLSLVPPARFATRKLRVLTVGRASANPCERTARMAWLRNVAKTTMGETPRRQERELAPSWQLGDSNWFASSRRARTLPPEPLRWPIVA